MALVAGQVQRYKIHNEHADHFEVRSSRNEAHIIEKHYLHKRTLRKNQFIELHTLEEKDGSLHLSTRLPMLRLNETGALRIAEENKHGYFLSNGVERDLLLPGSDKKGDINVGDSIIIKIVNGDNGKPKATMNCNLRDIFKEGEYHVGDRIKGKVVNFLKVGKELRGIQLLIDDELLVFIHHSEMELEKIPKLNTIVEARIIFIRADQKVNATLNPHIKDRLGQDKQSILDKLYENNSALPYSKQTSPEELKEVFGLSKKAFKRALLELKNEGRVSDDFHKIVLLN